MIDNVIKLAGEFHSGFSVLSYGKTQKELFDQLISAVVEKVTEDEKFNDAIIDANNYYIFLISMRNLNFK